METCRHPSEFSVQLDFRFWISKLEELRQQFVDTIEKLDLRRRQMESYLSKLEAELKLAQENLYDREKRHQCDLVHDDLQCELIRLIDLLTDGQRTLKNDFEQIGEHSRCSRDLLREINLEANQKLHALSHQTAALHSTHTLPCYSNPEDLQQLVPNEHCHADGVTYIRWCKRMQGLAEQAEGILQGSRDLLLSNRHLPAFETTIVHQWQRVDDALERHVQDLHCIRDQLHDQLDDVHENVLNTAKSIEFLRKSIEDQSAYANVIQCRVALLSTRTPSENITDVEYPKLLEELNDLQCSMARLRRGMSQEEGILQHLIRLKTTLQEDLATKNNSLFIHREKIIGQRRTNKKIVTHGLNVV